MDQAQVAIDAIERKVKAVRLEFHQQEQFGAKNNMCLDVCDVSSLSAIEKQFEVCLDYESKMSLLKRTYILSVKQLAIFLAAKDFLVYNNLVQIDSHTMGTIEHIEKDTITILIGRMNHKFTWYPSLTGTNFSLFSNKGQTIDIDQLGTWTEVAFLNKTLRPKISTLLRLDGRFGARMRIVFQGSYQDTKQQVFFDLKSVKLLFEAMTFFRHQSWPYELGRVISSYIYR